MINVEPRLCDTHEMMMQKHANGELDARTAATTLFEMKRHTGHIDLPESEMEQYYDRTVLTQEQIASLPTEVSYHKVLMDAATAHPMNQGSCGSCYAWAATTAYGYRLAKASNMKHNVW